MYAIQILNLSTLITQAELAPIVAALQVQLDRDFVPAYGQEYAAKLALTSSDNGKTPIYIIDTDADAPPGALAWHTITGDGRAYGIVPMAIVRQYGADPGATISHELLELLADPTCERTAPAVWPPNSRLPAQLAYEDCDPVEGDAYPIVNADGSKANVSNFVLPSWFVPGSAGPWDFLKKLHAPLTLTAGGYLQWTRGQAWHQVQAAQVAREREAPHFFKRFQRRSRLLQEKHTPGLFAMLAEAERQVAGDKEAKRTLMSLVTHELGPQTGGLVSAFLAGGAALA